MRLENGVYTITNVASANLAALRDGNRDTNLVSSSGNDPALSHKVTKALQKISKNGRYTIQNHKHGTYARCKSEPREQGEIYAGDDPQYWEIISIQYSNRFTICSTYAELYWGSSNNVHETPLELVKSTRDRRNQWIFQLQPTQSWTIVPIRDVATPLVTASKVLDEIYQGCAAVEIRPNQRDNLVHRAEQVFERINEVVRGQSGAGNDPEQHEKIGLVINNYMHIRDSMYHLSSLTFFTSLLQCADITRVMENAHRRLDECLINIPSHTKNIKEAHTKDMRQLEHKLSEMEQDETRIPEVFDLRSTEYKDAITAMQRFIARNANDSPERRILSLAISVLAKRAGQKVPRQLPDWVISSFDIEIDMTSDLGAGGFGTVKKGIWNGLVVAVKQMTMETVSKDVLKEIQIWQRLGGHDHILPFYGASVTARPPFIVSRFMKNGNAVRYIQRNSGVNIMALIHEISLGMIYLHSKDIIHADLKGANVLIDDSGKACIADFGLARIRANATSRMATKVGVAGTARFMSPEHMKGKLVKPSDVYSFAMTMYELLTGSAPFSFIPDTSLFDMIAIQYTRLERPDDRKLILRGLDDAAWNILWRCSMPEKEERPTFVDVEPDLRRLATDRKQENWSDSDDGSIDLDRLATDGGETRSHSSLSRHESLTDHEYAGRGTEDDITKETREYPPPEDALEKMENADQETKATVSFSEITSDTLTRLVDEVERRCLVLPDGSLIRLSSSNVIISALRSIVGADTADQVRRLHPLLYDFLTKPGEGDDFRIDLESLNEIRAFCCLTIMNNGLKFNICGITDSTLLNEEVEDLTERMDRCVSEPLRYSCRSFAQYLVCVRDPGVTLVAALEEFLSKHLLHWIEVMSLLKKIPKVERRLKVLASWMMKRRTGNSDVATLVQEAKSFVRNFERVLRLSALHTYTSALPLTPKGLKLVQSFISTIPHTPEVISSRPWFKDSWVLEGHTSYVDHVVFSPNGKKLASGSTDSTIRLWNVETGRAIGSDLEGHTSYVSCVAFSPDGKILASASYDSTVRLWDAETGTAIGSALEGHTSAVCSIAFSPDGKKLASGSSDSMVQLWDVDTGDAIGSALEGHMSAICFVVFSPDGKKLASGSSDNTARLWDATTGESIGSALRGHTARVSSVVFSPDGQMLASASYDSTVRLWDVDTGREIGSALHGHTSTVYSVVFSPDGKTLTSASSDNTVRLWNVDTGEVIGSVLQGHTSTVCSVMFSPDGKKIASTSWDNTVRLLDVGTGDVIGSALEGHTSMVLSVAFSPDGKKLASGSCDCTVRLWDVDTGEVNRSTPKGHTGRVSSVTFSPDGKKLASSSGDHTVRLWDVETGRAIGSALEGHTSYVYSVVFSPDGKRLASASSDSTVRLWDVDTGRAIGSAFQGHTSIVYSVVFSPDGKKLASASRDHTVRLWDVDTGTPLGSALEGHSTHVTSVLFSRDGKQLASASSDDTVRLWDVDTGHVIGSAVMDSSVPLSRDNTAHLWNPTTSRLDVSPTSGPSDLLIDKLGFLRFGERRLWLPVPLRGSVVRSNGAVVVVGGETGAVTFIRSHAEV